MTKVEYNFTSQAFYPKLKSFSADIDLKNHEPTVYEIIIPIRVRSHNIKQWLSISYYNVSFKLC